MSLGKEVKKARIDSGLRQKTLCDVLDITPKYLSEIENDHVDPRWSIVKRIARVLKIPVDLLLAGEDSDARAKQQRRRESRRQHKECV